MRAFLAGQQASAQVAGARGTVYGSVSVVPGGSGWTAARIGVGGLGDSLRIWPLVGVPFI
jgi:hypothetical protein